MFRYHVWVSAQWEWSLEEQGLFFFASGARGGEWSGHCSYICLAASLSPYLCVCTLCAKIQSIATPAVERGEGQQPYWRSWLGKLMETQKTQETYNEWVRHISPLM